MANDEAGRPALNARLEQVRADVGAPTLRAFYARLAEADVPDFPSYAGAATFHNPPWRTPSLAYLQAILVRYPDVSPGWLLLGQQPPEDEVKREAHDALYDALRHFEHYSKKSKENNQFGALDDALAAMRAAVSSTLPDLVLPAISPGATFPSSRTSAAVRDLASALAHAAGRPAPLQEDHRTAADAVNAPFWALGLDPGALPVAAYTNACNLIAELLRQLVTSTSGMES